MGKLPEGSVDMVVCSPPYFNLRAYGSTPIVWGGSVHEHAWFHEPKWKKSPRRQTPHGDGRPVGTDSYAQRRVQVPSTSAEVGGAQCVCGAWRGELGAETTVGAYIEHLTGVFNAAARVMNPRGTLWVVLGDSREDGQLLGVPHHFFLAMREEGWRTPDEVIWSKDNPMPFPVTSRTVAAHEYVFMFSKQEDYHYDHLAIQEDAVGEASGNKERAANRQPAGRSHFAAGFPWNGGKKRNRRSVWTVPGNTWKAPGPKRHHSQYPEKLIEPMMLAGCPTGGTVLDPFCGVGTTNIVAARHGRSSIGIDIDASNIELAKLRLAQEVASWKPPNQESRS